MHSEADITNRDDRKLNFLRACRGEPVERVPVWMMRQAGRFLPEYRAVREKHSFLEVCKTPELAVEVSLQPFWILGVDAVIVFSDILIPAEAMGLRLEVSDSGPLLTSPIRERRDVERLREFDPEVETGFVPEAIRQLCKTVGPNVPVIGFAAAPWTLACYMVDGRSKEGFPETKRFMLEEPGAFRTLLEKIARVTARYLKAQISAGAAAVQLFDTWAGELSLSDYEDFALPATQLLLSELAAGPTPVILYSKASAHLIRGLLQTEADVLSLDWRVDFAKIRHHVGPVVLQGNVDPCVLLGPQIAIERAVSHVIDQTSGVGHILNLGHGILPSTPVENARAFVRAGQTSDLSTRLPVEPAPQSTAQGAT